MTDPPDPYRIESRSCSGLSDKELALCVALLKTGAAVDPAYAEQELPLARARAIAMFDDRIVGVGAIKRARPPYAAKVSRSSGYLIAPTMLELGYVTVDGPHRQKGLSSRIVDELLKTDWGALFATTDKDEMKLLLKNRKFEHRGHEWDGEVGCLSLWMRPA
jgi:hypothetical protein